MHTTGSRTLHAGEPVLLSRAERMMRTADCLEKAAATSDESVRQSLLDEVVLGVSLFVSLLVSLDEVPLLAREPWSFL